ncbi:hypothetical protein JTE90_027224 [Oedothorax gibbosus]|uniref:Uncharacterized protein n=1 Tax=Oedothorax gibbosus TaxID=931172 RepID=A0AAV6U4C6_9ARAC|nr:hypothetical protein JTE90_027224 [Oedothorax gibbosus]
MQILYSNHTVLAAVKLSGAERHAGDSYRFQALCQPPPPFALLPFTGAKICHLPPPKERKKGFPVLGKF